jgi:hypothetical protein
MNTFFILIDLTDSILMSENNQPNIEITEPDDIFQDENVAAQGIMGKIKNRYQGWVDKVIEKTSDDKESEKIYGSEWSELGFHKTIAGYTYTFGLLIPQVIFGILMIPLLQFTDLRDPIISGWDAVAGGLFGAVYTILDLDLENTINRFVPQYAISDPKKAMQYVGFFIKYQMWSGLLQVTFISLFIFLYIVPYTNFAYLAFYLLFVNVKQYPATLGTFHGLLSSLQHFDKSELIVFYRASILEPITKVTFGIAGLYFGIANPEWGELFGFAIGYAIGGYVDDFFTFGLGTYWLSKILNKYGIRIRDIYGDKTPPDVWKSALWFSARFMPKTVFSSVMGFAGFMIRVEGLPGYMTYQGLTKQAGNLAKFITWSDDIINKSKPVYSESYNNGKIILCKYYIAQGLKYNFWMLMILATLNVIALPAIIEIAIPLFIPETWRPIVYIVPFYVLFFLWQPFNDIADKMIFLSGHPEVNTYIGILDTILGLFFTWYFLIFLEAGLMGLIFLGVPTSLIGLVIRWVYMTKKVVHLDAKFWKDVAWQCFVAPFSAGIIYGGVVYILLYWVWPLVKLPFVGQDLFGLEGGAILIPAILLLLGILLLMIFLYLPLYAYFGGFDDMSLNIFRKSVGLTGPSLWLIYPMYKIFKRFHGISPFKKRSEMKMGFIAQQELRDLALMRLANMQKFNDENKE